MKYVYKAVTALLALGIIAIIIFVPLFEFCVKSSLLQMLNKDTPYIADSISMFGISEWVTTLGDSAGNAGATSEQLARFIPPILACVAFLVLTALTALIIAVLAIVRKEKYSLCCAAIFGIVFTYLFTVSFNELVAPFIDGSESLTTLFGKWWVSLVGDIEYIILTPARYLLYMLFIGILFWTGIYLLTEPKKDTGKSTASYSAAR